MSRLCFDMIIMINKGLNDCQNLYIQLKSKVQKLMMASTVNHFVNKVTLQLDRFSGWLDETMVARKRLIES